MTGRTNGTTPSFFATITIRPPASSIDHTATCRPRSTTSSKVGLEPHRGQRYSGRRATDADRAGLGHPPSREHDAPVYELTVQDQPFHIGLESLLWQEDLRRPPVVLGAQAGFSTNRV